VSWQHVTLAGVLLAILVARKWPRRTREVTFYYHSRDKSSPDAKEPPPPEGDGGSDLSQGAKEPPPPEGDGGSD